MDVSFDEELRTLTLQTIENVHALIKEGKTPIGTFDKKCKACSLVEICRPKELVQHRSAKQWLTKQLNELEK
jgi:CRISPR-associated exonuclease Cas4